ncbi:MAG: U32 family peptidase [Gammaproteobacteria bacterium]|nr:U32 family peptidase [Gammaproteobacteria bacterium]
MRAKLTIGPNLFHWPAEEKRDFYFQIADEAPVDTVYVGEVVCAKRTPYFEPYYDEVAERLKRGGKEVIFSTLAEVMIRRDSASVAALCALPDAMIEANDASALWYLSGRPHAIGALMNVYGEDTLSFLAGKGARNFALPAEISAATIRALAAKGGELGVGIEVTVYGRVSLALSSRCYHARAHRRTKDDCGYVCELDRDGLELRTLQGKPFLAVNGIQTLSHGCTNLLREIPELRAMGVTGYRLSPHSKDMVAIARLFRAVLDDALSPLDAAPRLAALGPSMPFVNGFYHHVEGYRWVEA